MPSLTHSTAYTVYVRVWFFSDSRWIVSSQFKLLVSVSQLSTALSNLFLLGISVWNEALLSLVYSVPTWWFNCNWLVSKNEQQFQEKCMGHNQPTKRSAEMQMIFSYLKQLWCSLRHFFFTNFSWITSCWCGISFHAFPGDQSAHAIYLAPGDVGKYHRHVLLQSLYSCLAANWFSYKQTDAVTRMRC